MSAPENAPALPEFIYQDADENYRVRLVKVRVAPARFGFGAAGYTYYRTPDGHFKVTDCYVRNFNRNKVWQVTALDGTEPFRGFGHGSRSALCNCDSLREAREEIASIYLRRAEAAR